MPSLTAILQHSCLLTVFGFVLAAASCSKDDEVRENKPGPQVATAPVPGPAGAPGVVVAPVAPKAPAAAIVTPGYLPPNPRVPLLSPEAANSPVEDPAAALVPPPTPASASPIYTPAQANQARLRALEEMYRQRGQPQEASTQPQPDSSLNVEKSVPLKSQP